MGQLFNERVRVEAKAGWTNDIGPAGPPRGGVTPPDDLVLHDAKTEHRVRAAARAVAAAEVHDPAHLESMRPAPEPQNACALSVQSTQHSKAHILQPGQSTVLRRLPGWLEGIPEGTTPPWPKDLQLEPKCIDAVVGVIGAWWNLLHPTRNVYTSASSYAKKTSLSTPAVECVLAMEARGLRELTPRLCPRRATCVLLGVWQSKCVRRCTCVRSFHAKAQVPGQDSTRATRRVRPGRHEC